MKIEYEYIFGLPRKIVWRYIKDTEVLKNSIPGCRSFVESSRGLYHAEIEINIGPIKDVFSLEVRMEKENSPDYFLLLVKGKGELGEINGKAEVNILEKQGVSKVTIRADAQVTGSFIAAGQRILEGGANRGLGNFFHKVEKEIKWSLYKLRRKR